MTADAGSALDVAGIAAVLEAALNLHLAEALEWDWDEDAPSHVPSVADVIAGVIADLVPAITPAIAAHVEALREADRAEVERVKALADDRERTAIECERLANGARAGLSDERDLRTAALVNQACATQIRAVLARTEPTQ